MKILSAADMIITLRVTLNVNPCPVEPGYVLPLQTVKIQISWLLMKPTDLNLHCLSFSNLNLYQQSGSRNLIG